MSKYKIGFFKDSFRSEVKGTLEFTLQNKIQEVVIVRDIHYKNPFLCPICKSVIEAEDYLRFYLNKSPHPICVHEKCLIKCFIEM